MNINQTTAPIDANGAKLRRFAFDAPGLRIGWSPLMYAIRVRSHLTFTNTSEYPLTDRLHQQSSNILCQHASRAIGVRHQLR